MSNAKVDAATKRSSGPSASIGRTAFSSVAMPPWVTLTAFGRPVDPEVKIVTAVADGGRSSTGTLATPSAGPAASVARSTTGIGVVVGGGAGAPSAPLSTTIAATPASPSIVASRWAG